jgi:hypothetical protein
MKRILIVVAAGSLLAFLALAGSFTGSKTPSVNAAPRPFGPPCAFPDSNGAPVLDLTAIGTTASHNNFISWSCDGTTNWFPAKVTKFGDFFCASVFGPGATGSATVWPSGKASFSCRVPA